MNDRERMVLTLLVALLVPWVIALIANVFIREPLLMLAIGIALSAWILIAGFQKNGELENSVGGLFGQMTTWVIPSGISWWVPKPFGQALRKTSVGKLELDHTRASGKHSTMVETNDGVQVEVSYYCLFRIAELSTWVTVEEALKALDATMDRSVRWFVSFLKVDEITSVKKPFSDYLMGKAFTDSAGNVHENDIREILMKDFGVEMISARVDDVNPPKSIVEANEAEAREDAEARREKKNMASRATRAKELKAILPGISDSEALRASLAVSGDIDVIDVTGGGDFAKGAAIQTSKKRRA